MCDFISRQAVIDELEERKYANRIYHAIAIRTARYTRILPYGRKARRKNGK